MKKLFLSISADIWKLRAFRKLFQQDFKWFSMSKTLKKPTSERLPPVKNQNGVFLMDSYLPNNLDIMLTDVHEKDLHSAIAKKLKITYLGEADRKSEKELNGILWGMYDRVMVPIIMEFKGKRKYVFFLVDTGSPKTFVSEHVFRSFGQEAEDKTSIFLNGHEIVVFLSPLDSHFADVNVLGADFLRLIKATIVVSYEKNSAKITGVKNEVVFFLKKNCLFLFCNRAKKR